jgi:hypothetical protein
MVVPRFAGWDGTARGFFTLAGAAILCARLLSACRAGRLPPSAGRSPDGCSVHRAADRRVPPTRPRPRLMARLPLLGSRVDVGEATPQFPVGEPWRANMPNLFQALANSPHDLAGFLGVANHLARGALTPRTASGSLSSLPRLRSASMASRRTPYRGAWRGCLRPNCRGAPRRSFDGKAAAAVRFAQALVDGQVSASLVIFGIPFIS